MRRRLGRCQTCSRRGLRVLRAAPGSRVWWVCRRCWTEAAAERWLVIGDFWLWCSVCERKRWFLRVVGYRAKCVVCHATTCLAEWPDCTCGGRS